MSTDVVNSSRVGSKRRAGPLSQLAGLSRGQLFGFLVILGLANSVVTKVHKEIVLEGFFSALSSTFNISAIVWVAAFVCPCLLLRDKAERTSARDLVAAGTAAVMFLLPLGPVTWVTLTGLALFMLFDHYRLRHRQPADSTIPKGAWILLAMTASMFWGRILLTSASGIVLTADAMIVSLLVGTERIGNTVQFIDGSGFIWVEPGCSSLTNISLAVLCWAMFAQSSGMGWSWHSIVWCALGCASVSIINIARMGMMVVHPAHFDLIHGPVGAGIAGTLSMAVMVGICLWGTRRARNA